MRSRSWFALGSLAAAVIVGVAVGLGAFTFAYARGASYLGNDPRSCANCHVMRDHLDAWESSSHRAVATCNDCHSPHSLLPKYWVKLRNGWHHSVAFTTGDFHEPIVITPWNLGVTEGQCRHCHQPIVQAIDHPHTGQRETCVRCHRNVGHMH